MASSCVFARAGQKLMQRMHCSQVLDHCGVPSRIWMLAVGQMRLHWPQPVQLLFARNNNQSLLMPREWNEVRRSLDLITPNFSRFNGL